MSRILSVDPSGTSTTGLFYFENWGSFKIYHFTSKNWLEHAEFLENEIKNKKIEILVVETGKLFSRKKAYNFSYQMDALIKCAGACEWIAKKYGCELVLITNLQRKFYEKYIISGGIPGLELKKVKRKFEGTTRLSSRELYFFKDQELNVHEKDAVMLLFVYITKKQKKVWPFAPKKN